MPSRRGIKCMAGLFNPAFYVRVSDDGERERYLPLSAKVLWMNSERPGWRVTADSMQVFAVESFDESGNKINRPLATMYVSIVNEQGQRIATHCATCEIEDGEFGLELEEIAADFALEMLGYNVGNITEQQWSEAMGYDVVRKALAPESTVDFGVTAESENGGPGGGFVQSLDEGGTVAIGDYDEAFQSTPSHLPPEIIVPDEQSPAEDDERAYKLFTIALAKSPGIVRGVKWRENMSQQEIDEAFERYCLGVCGISWYAATGDEKSKILESLLKHSK